jgi:hypothetical protein
MGVIKAMAAEMVECIPRGLWEKEEEKTKQEQAEDGDVVMGGQDDEEEVDDAMDIDQEAEDQLLQEQGLQPHRTQEQDHKQEKKKQRHQLQKQQPMLLGDALQLLWPLRVIAESPIALELHRSAAVKGLVSLGREYGVGQALAAVAVGRGV